MVFASNAMDRLAFGMVLQDIKLDLALSDTQLGFLTGIAFALFYSVMGIPIARWADRGNRVTIIAISTALWSAMVALCGLAGSFLQLLLIRVGVAVGEAGCLPPANSLIADYFSRAERPRAISIYMLGAPVGCAIGFLAAGWLNELYGWRVTFIALGLPGIALAALVRLTLKEPRRVASTSTGHPGLREVCRLLMGQRTFRHLMLSVSVMSFFTAGVAQWQPAFFVRTYGLETGELGSWLAAVYGLSGLIGTYYGGSLASRYAPNNERVQLSAMAVIYASFSLISMLIYLSPNRYVSFALMAVALVAAAAANGPLFAALNTLVPARMRATAIALVYLFANLIGMGLGPLVTGALSDAYKSWAGDESLRYALVTLCPGYLWGAWHVWRASRTILQEIQSS